MISSMRLPRRWRPTLLFSMLTVCAGAGTLASCGGERTIADSDATIIGFLSARQGSKIEGQVGASPTDTSLPIAGLDAPIKVRLGQTFTLRTYFFDHDASGPERVAIWSDDVDRYLLTASEGLPSALSAPGRITVDSVLTLSNQAAELRGKTIELKVSRVGANLTFGAPYTWTFTIADEDPQVCLEVALCGPRTCGLDPACGQNCGTCDPGFVCSYDGMCQPVGPSCPELKACEGRVCGIDPICGAPCGEACPTGFACDANGQCLPTTDETSTDTTSDTSATSETSSSTTTSTASSTSAETSSTEETSESDECPVVGEIFCGSEGCIDPKTSKTHCGARNECLDDDAGTICEDGQYCANGACKDECPQSHVICEELCIDPLIDLKHCGAKEDCLNGNGGQPCKFGEVCAAGVCKADCPAGQILCEGVCTNPQNDNVFCGAKADCRGSNSGERCEDGTVCADGVCAIKCPGTQIVCGGKCISPETEEAYCGAKGDCIGPNAGTPCDDGMVCDNKVCKLDCAEGQVKCDGSCIDPSTDSDHCGTGEGCMPAGTRCFLDEICVGASCVKSPSVWTDPRFLSSEAGSTSLLRVAATGAGVIAAAWVQSLESHPVAGPVGARLTNAAMNFGPTLWLANEASTFSLVGSPSLSAGPDSVARVAFVQADEEMAGLQSIAVATLDGTAIAAPTIVANAAHTIIGSPALTTGSEGTARVIWIEREMVDERAVDRILSSEHDGKWFDVHAVYSEDVSERAPDVEIGAIAVIGDSEGDATVVFTQQNLGNSQWSLWSTSCSQETCDAASMVPDVRTTSFTQSPRLTVRDNRGIVAVWEQKESGVNTVFASTKTVDAATFSVPKNLSYDYPRIYGDSNLAGFENQVWTVFAKQNSGGDLFGRLSAARHDGSKWLDTLRIPVKNDDPVFQPAIAFNAAGHALAAWVQDDAEGATNRIYASLFDQRLGRFATPVRVDTDATGHASRPFVVSDANDAFIVVWEQKVGADTKVRWSRATLRH
jgi:hypothetical protein